MYYAYKRQPGVAFREALLFSEEKAFLMTLIDLFIAFLL